MSRGDRDADRQALLEFAREAAHCGVAEIEKKARAVLTWIDDDEKEDA